MKSSSNPRHWTLRKGQLLACLALLSGPTAYAGTLTTPYQYFRFTTTKCRSSTTEFQMSEFKLLSGATDMTSQTTVSATGSSTTATAAEGYNKVKDGSVDTKWFSTGKPVVTFAFTAPTLIDGYSYATANDLDGRDPVSWVLEASNDNATWSKIDFRNDYPVTVTRKTWLPTLVIPDTLPPQFNSFTANPSVIKNGETATLQWDAAGNGNTYVLNPGAVSQGGNTFTDIAPPANADTAYTVTATNNAGTGTSSTATVRTVVGGSATARYVRFTPIALRNLPATATSIQLSELYFKNGDTQLTAVAATNVGGNNPTTETPAKAIDNDPNTKWLDFNKKPLVIDFGTSQTFTSYGFQTGADAPERDPVRWTLEASDDNTTWHRIDDLSTFDVYVSDIRQLPSQDFPIPGASLPPVINTFTQDLVKVVAGDPLTFTWATADAATVKLNPGNLTLAANGTTTLNPTAGGTYTLSAASAGGTTVTKTLNVQVAPASTPALPNYTNFDSENGALSLVGTATVMNDFATTPNPGNFKRLRLTPDLTSRAGSAWFPRKVAVSDGFDVTFGAMLTKTTAPPGADGIAFLVQNDIAGNLGLVGNGEAGVVNSIAISLDNYPNAPDTTGAVLKVFSGATQVTKVDLSTIAGITVNTSVTPKTLTDASATAVPHIVHVVYASGALNVFVDNVQVITNQAIDLTAASAMDANGKAWVGFTSRTGGFSSANDITSWTMSTGAAATNPLAITAYTLNATTGQGSITWSSNTGKTYRITQSTDLVTFASAATGIASQGASTTSTFTFTPGAKMFFRVEEQ